MVEQIGQVLGFRTQVAGCERMFKLTKTAVDIADDEEFAFMGFVEGLPLMLAHVPGAQSHPAAECGRFEERAVVAGPGGVHGGPPGICILAEPFEDKGVADEFIGFLRKARVTQLGLVDLAIDHRAGLFVDAMDVVRAIAAEGAALHPEGQGRTERFAWAGIEVRRLQFIGMHQEGVARFCAAIAARDLLGICSHLDSEFRLHLTVRRAPG